MYANFAEHMATPEYKIQLEREVKAEKVNFFFNFCLLKKYNTNYLVKTCEQ